ncbi:MAG TPA: phenylalanine--tRNA ligase subunit beta [Candidatus Obscuribacterales bacterium]
MKLSYEWLSDFVDLSGLTPQEVADKLTMGAFEVEEIKQVGANLQGEIVVGEIMEIVPHPDPSVTKMRLTRTRVRDGAAPEEIVCGAWNIEVGQKIPVALPGSVVINRTTGEPFPIQRTEKRGVVSNGMLCSPAELGIAGGEDGILILDPATKVGINAKEHLGLQPDTVLIVEPRSNRGDALCVLGLAREVAALFGRSLKAPQWQLPAAQPGDKVSADVENTDDCPFFTIRVLSGIKIGASPSWMVRRLEAVGMRSVNNVVDITNYVMQELGQPLHAYDLRKVNGAHLAVRRARDGETLTTLDEKKRELNNEILVIADKQGVVGIAGVMGGKGSEIADDTTTLALEAACFNSRRVRRSSRLLGLSSDSSLRFERGVDLAGVRQASDRAAHLLVEHCGAKLHELSTAGSDKLQPVVVPLRLSEVQRLTELEVTAEEASRLLAPLGFATSAKHTDRIEVSVPSFRRRDVSREVDLVEEVTRLYGYDKVPVSMPKRTVAPPLPDTILDTIKEALSACGLNEAWISSLVSLEDLTGRGSFETDDSQAVKVLNPLSDEHQVLRQSLLPGLLKALAYNQDRGMPDVWLFETGLTYRRLTGGKTDRSNTGTEETLKVASAITGQLSLSQLSMESKSDKEVLGFYQLKGVLQNLFERLGIAESLITYASAADASQWFHPSRCAAVSFKQSARDKESKLLGFIAEIHPLVGEAYGLKKSACVFELDVEGLRQARQAGKFAEIYNTPVVSRDLTGDVAKATEQAALKEVISQVGGKLLRKVELVSIFDLSGEQKSLSYRLSFQDPEKTLTADEIDKSMSKIREQLTRRLSVSFRI